MSRHTPLIFVLLLAATLSVDAVVAYVDWSRHSSDALDLYVRITLFALMFGELGVASIWAVFSRGAWSVRWGLPAAATLFAGWLTADRGLSLADTLGLWGSYALVTSIVLWALKHTSTWRRLARYPAGPRWQFGVKHVLLLMTIIGTIIVAWRAGELFQNSWNEVVFLVVGSTAIVAGATFIRQLRIHFMLRLAALLALGLAIGVLASWTNWIHLRSWTEAAAFFLIQAVVLAAWLELVPIIPRPAPDGAGADR